MNANLLLKANVLRFAGEAQVRSNGLGAKSAPVKVVANTGAPTYFAEYGTGIIFDFDSMTHKGRIPLDFSHDASESTGYLNKIEVVDGQLVCSGAIVAFGDDKAAEVIAKMSAGVPYQASVESHGGVLELIAEGDTAFVNGREQVGPFLILRDWELAAVAVCKFGRDSETSAELLLAAAKKLSEKHAQKKEQAISTTKHGEMSMQIEQTEQAPTVEAAAEEVKADEVKAEEAVAEVTEEPVSEPVEAEAKAVEAIAEAEKEEVKEQEAEKVVAEPADLALAASEPAVEAKKEDPREEFKKFVASFGNKAADYYAAGLSYADATTEHLKYLAEANAVLAKRLAAMERGAAAPVKVSDRDAAEPVTFADLFRMKK